MDSEKGFDSSKASIDIPREPKTPQEETLQAPEEETSPRDIHGWKWVLVCCSIYFSALIYGLDSTIAADVQGAVVSRFNDVERLTWIGTGFPLGSVCAVLPAAALYANFDVKKLFIGAVVLFEIGSAICGAAPSMSALIVGRVIAGLGGSGLYLGCLNYITLCTTDQERGSYIAGLGAVWGTGAVLGPVVGGAFSTSSATWRWAFYINLVIAALCAPVYVFYVPSVKPPGAPDWSIWRRLKRMDWCGFIAFTGAIIAFVLVLSFAGIIWRWNDGRTIATFVVAGVVGIVMLAQQYFVLFTDREVRMFPPKNILSDYTLILINIITAAAAANIFVPLYYIPLYCQFVHGDSAIWAAVRLLPYICFLVSTNLFAGSLLPKVNYYWAVYLTGGILTTAGASTLFTVDQNVSIGNLYGYSILLGAGTGLIFNAGYTVAGVKTMLRTGSGLDVQRAISMINLSQLGFQMCSLVIGGQIFQSIARARLTRVLAGEGLAPQDISRIIAGTQSSLFESLSQDLREKAVAAITLAISRVYIISISAGAITIICALLMKKEPLFPRTAAQSDIVVAGGV